MQNNPPELPPPPRPNNANETKERLFMMITGEGVEAFNAFREQSSFSVLDLSGLDFTAKDMTGINLSNTNLVSCIFDYAFLADASFLLANMQRCSAIETDFFQASLDEVELGYSNLYKANFSGVSMSEAILTGCQARGAKFIDADLSDSKLNKGDWSDVDFTGAILNGASFKDSAAYWSVFDGILQNEKTILPLALIPDDEVLEKELQESLPEISQADP